MCTALTISPDYRPFSPYHVISHPLHMQFKTQFQVEYILYFHFHHPYFGLLLQIPKGTPFQILIGASPQFSRGHHSKSQGCTTPNSQVCTTPNSQGCTTPNSQGCRLSVNQYHKIPHFCFVYNIIMPSFNTVHFDANYSFSCS